MRPGENVPPMNPRHILELSDDGPAASCPKKVTGPSTSTKPNGQLNQVQSLTVDEDVDVDEDEDTHQLKIHRKKSKARPIVIESSDESDSDQINDNNKKTNIPDSDNEKIDHPSDSPEEELGKLSTTIVAYFMITYQNHNLKNAWPKIGPHPFTDFSIRVPQLNLLTVVVATSSSVPHLFAKERARGPGS